MRAWLVEALTSLGGTASPLEVSRHVWAHHRPEIEATGDLLLTWQVDLHAAATANGGWSLAPGNTAGRDPARWDEGAIAVAVDAYVVMLRDHHGGRPVNRAEATRAACSGTGRTSPVVEAMFSNVSAVVQELGLEPLPAYPPRSNVPTGVRQAVRAALA